MRTGLKVSRGIQLVGAVLLICSVVACSTRSTAIGPLFILGFGSVIGARIYEWMTKE